MHPHNKFTIEDIKKKFNQFGFKLLDEKYLGSNHKYKVSDNESYLYFIKYTNLNIEGFSPEKFHTSNPFTIDNINLWCKYNNYNYRVVSDIYKNNEASMKWAKISDETEIIERSWKSVQIIIKQMKNGKLYEVIEYHKHKNRNIKRNGEKVTDEILNYLDKFGEWEVDGDIEQLYSKEYNIPIIHKQGFKSFANITKFRDGHKPSLFMLKNTEIKTHNLYTLFKNRTEYGLKDKQKYTSMNDVYTYICNIHGEFKNKLSYIIRGKAHCPECIIADPSLINKERETPEYKSWRIAVFERDKYKCVRCGSGTKIIAHHKDAYHWCVNRRTDISNGATLCTECHISSYDAFHHLYGNRHNTEKQFDEWMSVYNNKFKKGGSLILHRESQV